MRKESRAGTGSVFLVDLFERRLHGLQVIGSAGFITVLQAGILSVRHRAAESPALAGRELLQTLPGHTAGSELGHGVLVTGRGPRQGGRNHRRWTCLGTRSGLSDWFRLAQDRAGSSTGCQAGGSGQGWRGRIGDRTRPNTQIVIVIERPGWPACQCGVAQARAGRWKRRQRGCWRARPRRGRTGNRNGGSSKKRIARSRRSRGPGIAAQFRAPLQQDHRHQSDYQVSHLDLLYSPTKLRVPSARAFQQCVRIRN
jgi:hypothetical protein